jgi:hypothetical protein
MNRLLILIIMTSALFGVKTVTREEPSNKGNNPAVKNEVVVREDSDKPDRKTLAKEKTPDYFHDADSNSVNDQREEDFQKIKSFFKNLFNKEDGKKQKEDRTPTKEESDRNRNTPKNSK